VRIWLDAVVWGFFEGSVVGIVRKERSYPLRYKRLLIASGASEKVIAFPGWILPGVMSAGAIQTLVNVYRVLPGQKVLMIGSGNVGLLVGYQLLQAGAQVVIVEPLSRIRGYEVHAEKLRRAGVPFYLSHTIKEALGNDSVGGAVIQRFDSSGRLVTGTERVLEVDTICLAVGLSPQVELLHEAGCFILYSEDLGGFVPLHSPFMETTVPDIFVAGDCAGIGEASSAMEEGRIAGWTMAESLGYPSHRIVRPRQEALERLDELRKGFFGEAVEVAKSAVFNKWKGVTDQYKEMQH
jgi:thioredoxin reductase